MRLGTRETCPWCGQVQQLVWVHGHSQCAACGINYSPCCQGEADLKGSCGLVPQVRVEIET